MKHRDFDEETDKGHPFGSLEVYDLSGDEDIRIYEDTKPQEQAAGEEHRGFFRELMGWVVPIAIAVLVALVLKNYVIINATVPTGSMLDTIQLDDNLIGFRLAYTFSEPQRGDIIIFYYPDDESKRFIKRIIGLPGETVVIEDAKIYIDGSEEPLREDYLRDEWIHYTGPYEFEIPEDCYLVLGDNRNDSADARFWTNTYVTKEKIIAKAVLIYYPFHDAKVFKTVGLYDD